MQSVTADNELLVSVGSLMDIDMPMVASTPTATATPTATKSAGLKRRRANERLSLALIESNSGSASKKSKATRKSASSARPKESALSNATWNRVQRLLLAAKSLRNITRVTLAFFKEQEIAQLDRAGITTPTYPVPVSLTEVYSMLMSKKRRVYDALHVLEGVGILKRVHDTSDPKISRFRRGQLLYFGKEGAITWLQAIRTRARELVGEARRVYPAMTRQELDSVLLSACNIQAQIEGWSHLTATTVAFLTLLLESDDGGVTSLGAISRRIVEARLVCDGDVQSEVEINRRVYDLVSILASINAVVLSNLSVTQKKASSRRVGYATPRKGVTFNTAVLLNPRLLRVGENCSIQLEAALGRERIQVHQAPSTELIAPLCQPLPSVTLPNFGVEDDNHTLEDLFPDITPIDASENVVDWWNVALRGLLLRDALPLSDCLDWEIMQAISRARASLAATQACSTKEKPRTRRDVDLACHEELKAE